MSTHEMLPFNNESKHSERSEPKIALTHVNEYLSVKISISCEDCRTSEIIRADQNWENIP